MPCGWLTAEFFTRGGNYAITFGYDPAGNPTTFRGSGPNSFSTDNQISGAGYTYDGNGNPTVYKGISLTYDAEDHPTAFGSQMTAGYTGSGLRAWKQGAGGKTYFLYDGAAPMCELDSSGSVTAHGGSTFYIFDEERGKRY